MNNVNGEIKIFTGLTGRRFAQNMCDFLGATLGESETIRFSDGNIFVRIKEASRNKDVYLVQPIGVRPNEEFVELLFWIDAFKRASANSVTAILPYFSYAKGDKKDEARVSIRARVCAESIELAGVDRVITMDLHSPQVQGFFKKPLDHLYAQPLLSEYIKTLDYAKVDFSEGLASGYTDQSVYAAATKWQTNIWSIASGTRKFNTYTQHPLMIYSSLKGLAKMNSVWPRNTYYYMDAFRDAAGTAPTALFDKIYSDLSGQWTYYKNEVARAI